MILKFLLLISVAIVFVTGTGGPVGYDLYRDIYRLYEMRAGVHTKMFSSSDPKGKGADFSHYLRTLASGHCVLAEHLGPGEIDSIWSTRDNGVFNKTGNIEIQLDGITVVNDKLQDVLNGKLGAPFVWPLVGNGDDTSGGGVIKIPMPFQKSMRVTTDVDPDYFHVIYRTFPDTANVKTFDPLDPAEDVLKTLRGFGVRDPKPVRQNAHIVRNEIKGFSETKTIYEQTNSSGEITEIRLHVPQLVRSPRVTDDGRAFNESGWSQFYASIDPKNTAIRITRRLDPIIDKQLASIRIDGTGAGFWNFSGIRDKDSWAEETVVIDSDLTKDKSYINVKQEFISSSVDFNEFCYEIDSLVDGQWVRTDVIDIGPNHPGEESAHRYMINGQTFSGQRLYYYSHNSTELQISNQFLSTTRIKATFDGKVTVDAPFGQFFGSGLGMYDTRNLWFSIDARNAMFRTFWAMPFAKEAKIEIVFGGETDIGFDITSEVTVVLDKSIEHFIESKQIGYFYATHKEETPTQLGLDYVFLNTTGTGIFYGVSHTMRGLTNSTGNYRWYLEGNERAYMDGKRTPEISGTGTEDFYESGWYFRNDVTYNMPLAGHPGYCMFSEDCINDCTQANRIYASGVSFESSLVFGIEHGSIDDDPITNYSSVAFWYGMPEEVLKQTDFIDLNDDKSRELHNYSTEGETKYSLNSSYEGQKYETILESFATTTAKNITFKIAIEQNNKGVRIFRTSDQKIAYQCVDVFVNEQLIGRWLQPLGNEWMRFLDDSFDVSFAYTMNEKELDIKLVPVAYEETLPTIWSAIEYKIMTIVLNE